MPLTNTQLRYAASLVLRLFETHGESRRRPAPVRGGLGASRRRRVADFIEAHLEDDIGLAALIAEAEPSRHHFGKAFKVTFGRPPRRYIAERRVQKAKEMLLSDRASITDIALALGFSSHSHFTDVFRKTTGTTPSLFRGNCGRSEAVHMHFCWVTHTGHSPRRPNTAAIC